MWDKSIILKVFISGGILMIKGKKLKFRGGFGKKKFISGGEGLGEKKKVKRVNVWDFIYCLPVVSLKKYNYSFEKQ